MRNRPPPAVPDQEGTCPAGKVRYPDEETARKHIPRIQGQRAREPLSRLDKAPERDAYLCEWCNGWHLTSRPPKLAPCDPMVRTDGETWESYAHRLEQRIKEQRDQLESINALRVDAGNRHERKRIEYLTFALGRMTERWERQRAATLGAAERARRAEEQLAAYQSTAETSFSK